MRDLVWKDTYKMSRILKKMDMQFNISGDMSQEEAGVEMFLTFAENMHLAGKEASDFLGDLFGMTGEEFDNLPIGEAMSKLKEFMEIPDMPDFLESARKLMK